MDLKARLADTVAQIRIMDNCLLVPVMQALRDVEEDMSGTAHRDEVRHRVILHGAGLADRVQSSSKTGQSC